MSLPPPLVALSPGDLARRGAAGERTFLDATARAVRAGLRGILLREPALQDRPLLELARRLRDALPEDGWTAVHDRVHLAAACGAQAVHLGFRSLTPARVRRLLPDGIAIGFSAHAGDEPGLAEGSDYLFFGPVLETPSKRGWKEPVGLERLAREVRRSPVPVWAIGGIGPEHVRACLDAGCAGVAVRSGALLAADPAAACAELLSALAG